MRDLLTGLAIIVIVVLTTLLVAPYFVDWNGQRGFLEARLTRALGQKVTIGGDIDLKLLPTPYLRLNQTVIGGGDGPLRIGVRHLDFELAVAPLLHGEIDIVEGRLEEPTIRLALQPDRSLPALPELPALQLDIRLERVAVVDGTLSVSDPQSGRTFTADHLDFAVEAPSLAGPYRGDGTQGSADRRSKFRFSTAAVQRTGAVGRTRLRFAVDETAGHPGLDLDGDLAFAPAGADRVGESFAGRAVATGHLHPENRDPVGWRLAGTLKADPQEASLADGELRIGPGSGDLTLTVAAEGAFASSPDIHATLAAKQLDFDRLGAAPAAAGQAPTPPRLPGLASLAGAFAALGDGAASPLPTFVDVSAESAIWGGETLEGLTAHLTFGGPAPHPFRIAGDGPGGLHLDLDGSGGGVEGRLRLAATDLPRAVRWLRVVAPEEVAIGSGDPPFRAATLATRFKAGEGGLDLRNLTLALDRTTLTGTARIAPGEGGDAAGRVAAELATSALDIDALPDLAALQGQALPFDLAVKLDAGSLKVARAGSGPLDAGHLRLDVAQRSARGGPRLVVNDFQADDLGGARVHARGDIDGRSASLDLDVDAARLDAAAALLRQVAPGRAAEALAARAGALAPARLRLGAAFAQTDRGRLAPSRLDVAGTFGETTLAAHLAPAGSGIRLQATADTPRGAGLLRQLGLPVAAPDAAKLDAAKPDAAKPETAKTVGAGHVALTASGPVDGPLETTVEASLGGSRVAVNGAFELFATGRGGSGAVTLSSPDAMPLLQLFGLASPDARAAVAAELSGGLALGQTGVAVSDLKGRVGGVGVAGTLRWRSADGREGSQRQADDPALTGSLDVERLALADLAALTLGPSRQAPPRGPPRNGSAAEAPWSGEPFAAGPAEAPRSLIALKAGQLDLGLGLTARDASLDLVTAPGVVSLKRVGGSLAGGRVAGEGTLRRDGSQATLAGTVTVADAALATAAFKAKVTGRLDFAGGGASPLALVASLAGSGEATFADTALLGFDAHAAAGVFADTENDTLAVDEESIRRAFEATGSDRTAGQAPPAPLDAGTRRFAASLASGLLALTAKGEPVRAGPITASVEGSYDLRRLAGTLKAGETLTALPKNWTGPPPRVTVTVAGLPGEARRSYEVGEFVNAVAARAIARETARIEAFEFDVRERALFNARLIFDRRREQDRLKVEADAKAEAARKAEAERRARADAERLEKEREDRDAPPPPQGDPQFQAPSAGTTADPSAAGRY